VVVVACSVPLVLTVWALLDAASRPEWAWALAGRRRVAWLAAILFGSLAVVVGLVISGVYLVRIRPEVAAAEAGRVVERPGRAGPRGAADDPNSSGGGGP
jgi:hypothetical protein